jgi:erythronate-4-phosphate dehydrogenase
LRDPSFSSNSIEEILTCDVISFHVPLDEQSAYPTKFWLDDHKLKKFNGMLVINASRGGIVHEDALLSWKNELPQQRRFVLDVWEKEPFLNRQIAENAWIATPHIAGYSIQSKRNATRMVLKSMCSFFEYPNSIADSCTNFMNLTAYQSWHPLFELSEQLKQGLTEDSEANARHFRSLRQHSKLRNEFKFTTAGSFEMLSELPKVQELIKACGGPL